MTNEIDFPKTVVLNLVLTGQQVQPLGNQSILDGKKIRAIVASLPSGTVSASSAGGPLSSQQGNAFLRLVSTANTVLHDALRLSLLDPTANGTGQVVRLDTAAIDWTKSALLWSDGPTATAQAGTTVALTVVYE